MGSIPCTELMHLTNGKYSMYRKYAGDQWEVFHVQNVCSWPMGSIPCTECMQLTDGKYSVYWMCAAHWWEVWHVQNVCSWPMGCIPCTECMQLNDGKYSVCRVYAADQWEVFCTECLQLTNGKYSVCRMYAADWWELFHIQNVCSWLMCHYVQQINMRTIVMNTLRNSYVLHTDINSLCFMWCICRLDWCDKTLYSLIEGYQYEAPFLGFMCMTAYHRTLQ